MKKIGFTLFFAFFSGTIYTARAQTQAEMDIEAISNYKTSDSVLNKLYISLIKKLTGKEKELFIQAEKKWIQYRDAHCAFVRERIQGGSITPVVYYSCLRELTEERIEFFRSLMKDLNDF